MKTFRLCFKVVYMDKLFYLTTKRHGGNYYLNENIALITSMNLYGYSEENNREMGIEINRSENYEL